MFDIRCANCGSPHIKVDKENNGIKYNSAKGVAGAVVFGSGGAALGFENDTKTVYKCPDCGMTLSYTMPYDMARVIDLAMLSDDLSQTFSYGNYQMSWNEIKARYKNVGENIKVRSMVALSKESWVQNSACDFEESVKKLEEYQNFRFHYKFFNMEKYKEWYHAIDSFAETIDSYLIKNSIIDNDSFKKMKRDDYAHQDFVSYYSVYVSRFFEQKYNRPFGHSPEKDGKILFENHRDIVKTLSCIHTPCSGFPDLHCGYMDLIYEGLTKYIIRNNKEYTVLLIRINTFGQFYIIFPLFQVRDDDLYYSDWTYNKDYAGAYDVPDEERFNTVKGKYFREHPEKEIEFKEKESRYLADVENNNRISKEIPLAKKNFPARITPLKSEISELEEKIAKKQHAVLFKKKATEEIAQLTAELAPKKQKLAEIEAEYSRIISQKEKELPSATEFYNELIASMDYLQIWHKA